MGSSNEWMRSRQFNIVLEKKRTYSLLFYKLPNASCGVKNEFWKNRMYSRHFMTSIKLFATLRTNIEQFRLHSSESSNVLNFFLIVSYSKNDHHNSSSSFIIIYFKSEFLTKTQWNRENEWTKANSGPYNDKSYRPYRVAQK